MSNQEIYDLMERFGRSHLSGLKLSTKDYTIELSQGENAAPAVLSAAAAPVESQMEKDKTETAGPTVNAPMVGTFYSRPAPDQEPYVKAGDMVQKGDTLCMLEAMKMMNEIPAPCDLVIESVLKEDGELCSFGEPLLRYRTV